MIYEIEQYELHSMKYRIEAATEAEAVARLFQGEAEPVCQGLQYVEVAEDYGLPVDEYPELVKALRKLGVWAGDAVIPSIRSIEQV